MRPDQATTEPASPDVRRAPPRAAPADARLRARRSAAAAWLRAHRWPTAAALAFCVYLAFACFLTWPLVTDLDSRIFGGAGDLTGAMAYYRELVGHNPFLPGTIGDFNAPAGLPIRWPLNLATAPSTLLIYGLTAAFGSVAALGIYALMGFTLSGFAMFLLVRRLTGNGWIGLISGFAFAFYPFAVINGQGHLDFAHGWPLVVLVWRMLELIDRPTARNGTLAGLAAVLAFFWTPYFLLIGGVMFGVLMAVGLLGAARRHRLRASLQANAIAAAIALVCVGGLLVAAAAADSSGVRVHTLEEVFVYSARPYEYVIPHRQHPIFGGLTGDFLERHIHRSNAAESTLYVGIPIILLALVGVGAALLGRLPPRLGRVALLMGTVVLAALAVSAPPKTQVFGHTINLPSYYVFELSTTWRAYSRLVIGVMLGMTVLASLGLTALLRGRGTRTQAALLAVVAVLVGVDLWARPEGRTNIISAPPIFAKLKALPDGIVADYPLSTADGNIYNDLFEQGFHDKRVLNGYPADSKEEARALQLVDLKDRRTAERLALLDVDYVLARNTFFGSPGAGAPGPGMKLVARDYYARIYRIVDRHGGALATPSSGWQPEEPTPFGPGRWIANRKAEMEVLADCSPCSGQLRFVANSLEQPRRLTVRDVRGQTLFQGTVLNGRTRTIRLPVTGFSRRTVLSFEVSPAPVTVDSVLHNGDPREVSVFVRDLDFGIESR
jgi:hypothetical protein